MTSTGRGQSINTFATENEGTALSDGSKHRPPPPPPPPLRTMVNCHGHLTFISFSTEATSVQFMALCSEENDFRELLSFEITLWTEIA